MNGYFITGTGTGVGKTYVTATLARLGRTAGKRVFAFKPIETGCAWVNGTLVGSDQTILCEAAGSWQTGPLRGVYQFALPVAPSVAAHATNVVIDLGLIDETLKMGARDSDLTLVEGAGGWRVPIGETVDMATLAQRCGLPVIIVATATLGTINHSLLTIEAVERTCSIAALVLSQHPEDNLAMVQTNQDEIQKRWPGTVVVSTDLKRFT